MQRKLSTLLAFRTPAAAEYCGLSASTFEKYRISGEGPAYIKLGRRVVYDPDDLDTWLAKKARRHQSSSVSI